MSTIKKLTAEYLESPLGLETQRVRFGWVTESEQRGWMQKSYRLRVATTPELLTQPDMWDSGVCESACADNVTYEGKPLCACTRYYWSVELESTEGERLSGVDHFEMGLFDENFTAHWIGRRNPRQGWALYFRRDFVLKKPVAWARAYFCGLGVGDLYLNGQQVGDAIMAPPQTDYEKRVLYTAFDVTDRLSEGDNTVGAMVGDGWFHQNRVWANGGFSYGDCRMLLELHIRYTDGTEEKILSDEDFLCDYSPVTLNNIYGGETYDARLEQEGWCSPGFDSTEWQHAVRMPSPGGVLSCCLMPPVRKTRRVLPKSVYSPHKGAPEQVFLFDMGENFAGFVRLNMPYSPAGSEYVLRFAEDVDANGGLLYTSTGVQHTLVFQQDRYISRGNPDGESWEPRFTYHGFRYVEVTGLYANQVPENFLVGYAVNTDLKDAGSFTCSDEKLNKLYQLGRQTILSNYHGIPEDCPVRERCGWLGDAQLVSEIAMCQFDMATSYEKYMEDIRTSREVFGTWMMIAPGKRVCHRATPLWAFAQIIIPWNMYLYYGDVQILERYYADMKELIRYYVDDECINYILHFGLGDWCPPGGNCHNTNRIPIETSSTAELYHCTALMEKVAQLLGKDEDVAYFQKTAASIRSAFNCHYYMEDTHSYNTQGANGAALAFGLCPQEDRELVAKDAIRLLEEVCEGGMGTGIWGNKHLVPAMTEQGYVDEMLGMLFHPEKLSFATMFQDGAASIWECFEHPTEIGVGGSMNHPMQFAFASWLYTHLLGIAPIEEAPAFRRFTVCPYVPTTFTHAEGYRDTPYGRIEVAWKKEDGVFTMELTVPANTQAECALPITKSLCVMADGEKLAADTEKVDGRVRLCLPAGHYTISGR
ncbi:MAG: family 78 glycoside hydrolase catalytic domain [Clostridia bacterium]|nr:family 78 glycoside hydrolase catalytic domain [Clostridia bacterium]